MICKGYAEANKKFLKYYDILGHSMMQLLPIEIFDWVDPKYFSLSNYSNNSQIG